MVAPKPESLDNIMYSGVIVCGERRVAKPLPQLTTRLLLRHGGAMPQAKRGSQAGPRWFQQSEPDLSLRFFAALTIVVGALAVIAFVTGVDVLLLY